MPLGGMPQDAMLVLGRSAHETLDEMGIRDHGMVQRNSAQAFA
jgi:hypothetical protein